MGTFERQCTFCSTKIYWNKKDTTHKTTGSWYEVITNKIHPHYECKIKQEKQLQDGFIEINSNVVGRY